MVKCLIKSHMKGLVGFCVVARGGERPQHIVEISRMSDTYKSDTLKFVNVTEQVLDTEFVAGMSNTVVEWQGI